MTSDPNAPILDPADDGRQASDDARGETPAPPSPWADDAPTPTDAARGLLEVATWLMAEAGAVWHALRNALDLERAQLRQPHARPDLSADHLARCELLDQAHDLHAQTAALQRQLVAIGPGPTEPAAVVAAVMVAAHLAPLVGDLVGRSRAALVQA